MAPGLQLSQRLTQSLVLAPQLQQSLALLQAPTLELKALVEQELQQNPVLEEAAVTETDLQERLTGDGEAPAEVVDLAEPPADVNFDPATEKPRSTKPRLRMIFRRNSKSSSSSTRNGAIIFPRPTCRCAQSAEDEEQRQFMFDSLVAPTSLQEMLLEQVRESNLPEEQWPIAEMLDRQHRRLRLSQGEHRGAWRLRRISRRKKFWRC